MPSLINHFNVAAEGVKMVLPKLIPISLVLVDKDSDKLLANA
jgi:hypothetical protein